jgi:hypothetical protein
MREFHTFHRKLIFFPIPEIETRNEAPCLAAVGMPSGVFTPESTPVAGAAGSMTGQK